MRPPRSLADELQDSFANIMDRIDVQERIMGQIGDRIGKLDDLETTVAAEQTASSTENRSPTLPGTIEPTDTHQDDTCHDATGSETANVPNKNGKRKRKHCTPLPVHPSLLHSDPMLAWGRRV